MPHNLKFELILGDIGLFIESALFNISEVLKSVTVTAGPLFWPVLMDFQALS